MKVVPRSSSAVRKARASSGVASRRPTLPIPARICATPDRRAVLVTASARRARANRLATQTLITTLAAEETAAAGESIVALSPLTNPGGVNHGRSHATAQGQGERGNRKGERRDGLRDRSRPHGSQRSRPDAEGQGAAGGRQDAQ